MTEEYKIILRYWLEKGNIVRYHRLLYKLSLGDGLITCYSVPSDSTPNEDIINSVNSISWHPSSYGLDGSNNWEGLLRGLSNPAERGELQLLSLSPFRQPSSLKLNILYERLSQGCIIPIRVNSVNTIHYMVNPHGVLHYRAIPNMNSIASSSFFVSNNNVILEDYIRDISTKLLLFFSNDLIVR